MVYISIDTALDLTDQREMLIITAPNSDKLTTKLL